MYEQNILVPYSATARTEVPEITLFITCFLVAPCCGRTLALFAVGETKEARLATSALSPNHIIPRKNIHLEKQN